MAGDGNGLRRTPLYEEHVRLGARMTGFAGWAMPVEYRGILEEHRAVRERAGLFDVSHMGEIAVRGPGALALLQLAVTNDAGRLAVGQALYTPMCRDDGGILDDLIVYRTGEKEFLLVVNAANREKDLNWLRTLAGEAAGAVEAGAEVEDVSDRWALLALQGPRAAEVLRTAAGEVGGLGRFAFLAGVKVAGRPCLVARTGYTGEDGFELFCPWEEAPPVWAALLDAGREAGVLPCGLGARDTLRLEAALPLYGHELREDVNPLEVRLGAFVRWDKGEFVGRAALERVREAGPRRRLVGLEMVERGIPRQGYEVVAGGAVVGEVTSGGPAPTLGKNVALALVAAGRERDDEGLAVRIRGRDVAARVVPLPFYRRAARQG